MAKKSEKNTIVRVFAFLIFIYYAFMLLRSSIFSRLLVGNAMRGLSLIPFKSAAFDWASLKGASGIFASNAFKALSGPVFIFLPFGLLLPFLHSTTKKYPNVLGIAGLTSLIIELVQYLTRSGITSVDDIILNLVGASLGYQLYKMLKFAFIYG